MQPDEQTPTTEGGSTTPPESTPTVNPAGESAPSIESPTPVVSGTGPTVTPPAKRGLPKKTKLFAAIAGVAVLLIGGSAAAYFGVIVPNKPQRIVQDTLTNTTNSEKTKTAKFEGEVNCVSGDACKSVSGASFKGGIDEKGSFDLNVQLKTVVTSVGFDARSVGDKSIYLRLSGLDGLDKLLAAFGGQDPEATAAIAQYAPIIAQVNNQWYTVDESLLKQLGDNAKLPTNQDKISSADAKKIGDIYSRHNFIKIDKTLADEKIHNQNSYHVQATIDKAQLKAFATELKNANVNNLKIEQKDIDEIDKADFSKYPFELWVSKADRMLTQFAMTVSQDGTTVKVRVAAYDYNKPVTVEKPSGAKSILELVSQLAPLYSGGVQGADSSNPASLLGL